MNATNKMEHYSGREKCAWKYEKDMNARSETQKKYKTDLFAWIFKYECKPICMKENTWRYRTDLNDKNESE